MPRNLTSTLARACVWSDAALTKSYTAARTLWTGVWLGLLGREALHAVDASYYDAHSNKYRDDAYNNGGLRPWERVAIEAYFAPGGRLLVGSVGGGREPLALLRLGYEVDAFECNRALCASANGLLAREGFASTVRHVSRDECPTTSRVYDGLIVGWGGYMLIQGRARRVAFLRELRAHVGDDAPVLVSFFTRSRDSKRLRSVRSIASALRQITGREDVELGDVLEPNFVHLFTRDEIAAELDEAGFALASFEARPYGHAVGLAKRQIASVSEPIAVARAG